MNLALSYGLVIGLFSILSILTYFSMLILIARTRYKFKFQRLDRFQSPAELEEERISRLAMVQRELEQQ